MTTTSNLLAFLGLVVTLLLVWRQSWPARLRLFAAQSLLLAALAGVVGVLAQRRGLLLVAAVVVVVTALVMPRVLARIAVRGSRATGRGRPVVGDRAPGGGGTRRRRLRDHASGHLVSGAADRRRDPSGVRDGADRARALRHRPRRPGPHSRLPRLRERDLRFGRPGDLRATRHRRGRRLSRRAGDRPHHGGRGGPGPPRARLDRGRPPPGASRMILVALLAVPLVGAALSWRAAGRPPPRL